MPIGDLSACRSDVADAKASLRAWAYEADAEIERKIEEAKAQAKRLAPWAAGAAVIMGLIAGRGGRRGASGGGGGEAGGGTGWVGTARRGIGLLTTAIGIARVAMPIVQEVMGKRGR